MHQQREIHVENVLATLPVETDVAFCANDVCVFLHTLLQPWIATDPKYALGLSSEYPIQ